MSDKNDSTPPAANLPPSNKDEYCAVTFGIQWMMATYDLDEDQCRDFLRDHEDEIVSAMRTAGEDRIEAFAAFYRFPRFRFGNEGEEAGEEDDLDNLIPCWDEDDINDLP